MTGTGETSTNTPGRKQSHPLFTALAQVYDANKPAVLTLTKGNDRVPITVAHGRVISIAHDSTGPGAVIDMLVRSGLISEKKLARIERDARKRGLFIEDALLKSGLVSEGTLSAIREKLCLEFIMDHVLRTDIDVSAVWSLMKGTRKMCSLPIPFLLREAQRRAGLIQAVRKVVPDSGIVFEKTWSPDSDSPNPERWEDLDLSAAERQVYFFVDGKRSVSDLVLATCQSEFDVALALKSLLESGLVRIVANNDPRASVSLTTLKTTVRRLLALGAAMSVMLLLTGWGIQARLSGRDMHHVSPFQNLVRRASELRIEGAARLYELSFGKPPDDFGQLLAAGFLLPDDRRAAAVFEGGRLLPGPADGPAGHEEP